MKLSSRLSLAVTLVSAAGLFSSFVAVYLWVGHAERQELDLALTVQAQALAQQTQSDDTSYLALTEGVASVPETIRPLQRYVAVYDLQGKVLAASRNLQQSAPTLTALDITLPVPPEGEPFDLRDRDARLRAVAVPVGTRGQTLVYAVSSRSVDQDERFLRHTLALLFCATLLATGLFSRMLGERLARDVSAIGGVARKVASGDFAARVGRAAHGSEETSTLAADLDHMIEQLGALVTSQRVFVSYAAHELRSPLATLRGELQLALRRPRDALAYRRTIERVLSDVETLGQLSEDLLTLAHAQAKVGQKGAVRVAALIEDARRMASGLAEARAVRIRIEPFDAALGGRFLVGASNELARALRNLIDNAVTHSAADAEVVVRVRDVGSQVQVTVEDRGPGVLPSEATDIFKPFYRSAVDQAADRPGAGLGLPIAQQIARSAGGDVWLDTAHSPGACFVLALQSKSAPAP